jgi:uncharacterized repeat protein (TIGR01451 family)
MPVISLALLPLLHALMVYAAPPAAPALGFTVTPTPFTVTVTTTLIPCDPEIDKQVSPPMAKSGDLVTFTITVKNVGQKAAVNGQVQDTVPNYLEILNVEVLGEHHGQKHSTSGQTVTVHTGILGQDAEVTILIHTKVRPLQETPTPVPICVENVAYFTADNCPDRRAEAAPCLLPPTGGPGTWWMLAAGLATSVLVLSLALSKKWRTKTPDRV